MRPTRLGLGCALAGALTLISALSSGNNLLYLLYSQVFAALGLAWAYGRANLRGVSLFVEADPAEQGRECEVPVLLRNEGPAPRYLLAVRGGGEAVGRLAPGGAARRSLRALLPHRGRNRLRGLRLESRFPFGLWTHWAPGEASELLALPDGGSRGGVPELEAGPGDGAGAAGGPGEEFHGARPYDRSDDPRSINWKLSARTGAVFVNEYRKGGGGRRTVQLRAESEDAVQEAAAACRRAIEDDAEVRLLTPRQEVPYGRGRGHLRRLLEALALAGEGARPRDAAIPEAESAPAREDAALRWLTRVGLLWVYGSLFLVEEIQPVLLAALLPLFVLGLLLERRGGPWLPRRAWNLLSAAVLAYSVLFGWRVSGVTVATTELVAYLLLNRALSPLEGECGVAFVIQFLAFFLVCGQTISLWFFAFFLGYAAYAALWLTLAQGAPWPERSAWGPGAARAAASAFACGMLLFAVTPRVEPRGELNPIAAIGLDRIKAAGPSVVGFSESVSLGYFGPLKRSMARALRVSPVPAPAERPAPIHVRGAAYDTFDGRRWTRQPVPFLFRRGARLERAADGRAWGERDGRALRLAAPTSGERAFDVMVFPMNASTLFSVGSARAVEEESRTEVFSDPLGSAYFAQPYSGGVRYRVFSSPDGAGLWPSLVGAEALRPRLLQLPTRLDPRVPALARRLSAGAATDAERVERIVSALRGWRYSTFAEDGQATLEDFLFKTRRGNCEYFGTAAAVLLRALGVPTRLVTGFYADRWNEYGRFYDVRQADAHAWAEALVDGRWITVDATPPDGGGLARDLSERMSKLWDALEARWYADVIGYDRFAQRNTFLRFGRELERLPDLPWRRAGRLGAIAGVVAALALAWRRLRRRRRSRVGVFERAERRLRRAGLSRPAHETPLEFASAAALRRPSLAALVPLARLHYRDRFGPGLSRDERAEAEALLDRLREEVK